MCVVCRGPQRSTALEDIAVNLGNESVSVISIVGRDVCYTVGMTTRGMPELYFDEDSGVEGMSDDALQVAQARKMMLQQVVDEVFHIGAVSVFTTITDMVPGATVAFRSGSTDELCLAHRFYDPTPFTALKVVFLCSCCADGSPHR